MKFNLIKHLAIMALCGTTLASCVNKYEDEPLPNVPHIAFDETKTPSTLNMTTGETLRIEPVIIGGGEMSFEWKLDGVVVATTANFSHDLTTEGKYTIDFCAANAYGQSTKSFTLNVIKAIIPGVVFNTTEQAFTRSIGENIRLTAKAVGSTVILSQKWEVNSKNTSLSNSLNYPLTAAGTYTVKYSVTKESGEASCEFTVTAIKSPHNDSWFVMQDNTEYVFALASNPSKVLAHITGSNTFKVETYSGAANQKYRKGAYFGYSDSNIQLEYYNFYNGSTHATPANNGNFGTVTVNPDGTCPGDGWIGWYFIVNASGNIRMVNFLQTWDMPAALDPANNFPGALISLSEDQKTANILHYSRFKDGRLDPSEYNSFGDKYYDFKIIRVSDMATE